MNSWAVSACYPRSTFYPLSDGPSIQNHRITKSYFRTCLIRRSCSQARLCLCTQCAMSDRAERTFELLRYRSEEHTSELQSLMRISYAVFCLKKKRRTE